MQSVSYKTYHRKMKDYEKGVLDGVPLFLHEKEESRKGIIMVDFEAFLLLVHVYLNYQQEFKKRAEETPIKPS